MYRTIEKEKSPWLCVSVFQIKKGLKFIIMNKGKLFFTLLSLLAALAVNAQEFHFTGHAEGVCNSHMFTTVEGFYNDTIKIDSNGNFEFTAKVAKPQFAYFSIMEKQASLVLFVENGVNCHADITFQPAQMDGIEYNKAILNLKGNNENEYALHRDFAAWRFLSWKNSWNTTRMTAA